MEFLVWSKEFCKVYLTYSHFCVALIAKEPSFIFNQCVLRKKFYRFRLMFTRRLSKFRAINLYFWAIDSPSLLGPAQ